MNIIDHQKHLRVRQQIESKRFNSFTRRLILLCVVLVAGYGLLFAINFARPLPDIKPVTKNLAAPSQIAQLSWPSYGQSAVGELESGILASSPNQSPRPIASITKLMTALAIVRQKPLDPGQAGPTLTLTSSDVELYNRYMARNGAVVRVSEGEQISQYQALQAMLLSSSNNMSDTLARWAFGSVSEYVKYANTLADSLNMTQTTIADASGFSPQTVSTARDVILLGQASLREPVIVEIVRQESAEIPVHGRIMNVNNLLGQNGINGLKTGNTDEAGGCFVVSAKRTLSNGETKTLLAVVLHAPTRTAAMNDSLPLLSQTQTNFGTTVVAKAGDVVGYYQAPWGSSVNAVVKEDVVGFGWRGTATKPHIVLDPIDVPVTANQRVGAIKLEGQTEQSDIVLSQAVVAPSSAWRIRRAYQL